MLQPILTLLGLIGLGLMLPQVQAQQSPAFPRLNLPLWVQGDSLQYPWIGGWNAPQFSSIDLNNDGQKDLLVYDRAGNIARTFLNVGSTGQVRYRYAPEYQSRFPQRTSNFMLARDYNGDGIEDLFFFFQDAQYSGIRVLRGSYDADNRIQFELVSPSLTYTTGNFPPSEIFIFNPDLPAIYDVDGDGDLDILAFPLNFTFFGNVSFYANQSVERGFGRDSFIFVLKHECWGMFMEDGFNNSVILSPSIDSCANNPFWRSFRHLGATLTALDWNNDGATDLFMGDVEVPTINLLTSTKIRDTTLVISQDTTFPSYDTPIDLFTFPAAFLIDVNNDGKQDLILGINSEAFGEALLDSVAQLYLNTSNNDSMFFELANNSFFYDSHLDLGLGSRPCFVDYDGDGLIDIVVGNTASMNRQGQLSSKLNYYRNIGTATQPQFQLTNDNLAQADTLGVLGLHPSFGDLDGDGDLDLILGNVLGEIIYYPNIGTRSQPSYGPAQRNYQNIDVGSVNHAMPQLVDIDRDGDLDLMIGTTFNNIFFFENKGSATNPDFIQRSNTFGYDLNVLGSNSPAPYFYKNNDTFELYLGHRQGGIIHLNDIDNNITGLYNLLDQDLGQMFTGKNSVVSVADLDQDGYPDFIVGNILGGLSLFSSNPNLLPVSLHSQANSQIQGRLYPNPSRQTVHLDFGQELGPQQAQVQLYDALGRLIWSQNFAGSQSLYRIDLPNNLAAGYYFLHWQQGDVLRQTFPLSIRP